MRGSNPTPDARQALAEEIVGRLLRRHSTAAVLLHHAVAESLGLGPTDHKCLDLVREHGPLIARDLVALTGLTSGAVTGVVARLEGAGYLRREPDPHDQRKQILSAAPERTRDLEAVFGPIRAEATTLLTAFDAHDLAAIATFLTRLTDSMYARAALLRTQTTTAPPPPGAASPDRECEPARASARG